MIALCLLVITGCDNIKSKTEDLGQILRDVYTPQTLDQFIESKAKYTTQGNHLVLSQDVADRLYVLNGTELTETDLTRELDVVGVTYSGKEDNSYGQDIIRIKIDSNAWGYNNLQTFEFYIDNGIVVDYTVTPTR